MFCAFLHELWLRQNAEGDGSIFLRFSSVGRQHSFANAFHLSEDEEPIDAVDRDGREWRGVGLSQRPIWVLQVGFACVYFFQFSFILRWVQNLCILLGQIFYGSIIRDCDGILQFGSNYGACIGEQKRCFNYVWWSYRGVRHKNGDGQISAGLW